MSAGPYLTVWIGPSSSLDAAGVRHDVPRHLIGISTPYVRGEAAAFPTTNEDEKPEVSPADD